jgi:hypothetical protein
VATKAEFNRDELKQLREYVEEAELTAAQQTELKKLMKEAAATEKQKKSFLELLYTKKKEKKTVAKYVDLDLSAASRNVLNTEEIKATLNAIVDAKKGTEDARRWVNTVLYNLLLREGSGEYVVVVSPALETFTVRACTPEEDDYLILEKIKYSEAPDWAKKKVDESADGLLVLFKVYISDKVKKRLDHILDWMSSGDEVPKGDQITKITYKDAYKHADAWVKRVNARVDAENDRVLLNVLYTFEDGYFLCQLTHKKSFMREGKLLKHCVGSGNYYKQWTESECAILSLRDKENFPHVTIRVVAKAEGPLLQVVNGKLDYRADGHVFVASQVSSNSNGANPRYVKYLKELEEKGIIEDLMKHYTPSAEDADYEYNEYNGDVEQEEDEPIAYMGDDDEEDERPRRRRRVKAADDDDDAEDDVG